MDGAGFDITPAALHMNIVLWTRWKKGQIPELRNRSRKLYKGSCSLLLAVTCFFLFPCLVSVDAAASDANKVVRYRIQCIRICCLVGPDRVLTPVLYPLTSPVPGHAEGK